MTARLIAFDLDDTLAPSKSPIDPRMARLLDELLAVTEVCVISGGRFEQFRDQVIARMPAGDALHRLHLMPTCGTQYFRWEQRRAGAPIDSTAGSGTAPGTATATGHGAWVAQYAENLTDDEKADALAAVEDEARRLGLWELETWGPILEDRGSQITFSALGQEAPVDAKKAWDPTGERKNALRAAVQARLPELEVRSGGSTSVDITRRGIDKAYGMNKLAQLTGIPFSDMLFVGDRLDPDGNDFPVIALGIPTRAVEGWEQTAELIEHLIAESGTEPAHA